jgi:ribosomal protein L11
MLEIKNIIYLFIRSQMAEVGPPLGTILGNIGINATKFSKEFNDFTKDLPSYFILKVKIIILEDRSYTFSVFLPNTGFLLMLVHQQRSIKYLSKDITQQAISLKNVVQLAKLKFPYKSLELSIPIILGTVNSCKLTVIF